MQTPEQIANEILTKHTVQTLAPIADPLALKRLIAAALRTAVEQEQERTVSLLERNAVAYDAHPDGGRTGRILRQQIKELLS